MLLLADEHGTHVPCSRYWTVWTIQNARNDRWKWSAWRSWRPSTSCNVKMVRKIRLPRGIVHGECAPKGQTVTKKKYFFAVYQTLYGEISRVYTVGAVGNRVTVMLQSIKQNTPCSSFFAKNTVSPSCFSIPRISSVWWFFFFFVFPQIKMALKSVRGWNAATMNF